MANMLFKTKGNAAPNGKPRVYFTCHPEDFVRMKHGRDFDKFTREETAEGQILFCYDNGSVCYSYEFTEI